MGKYMRKSKSTDDIVSAIDVSHSPTGVRTPAQALAWQDTTTSPSPSPPSYPMKNSELVHLQFRDPKLEITEIPLQYPISQNPNPSLTSSGNSGSISEKDGVSVENHTEADGKTGADESFGDNDSDFDDVERRSTRESTPCSLIMDPKAISTPSSSTNRASLEDSNRKSWISVEMSTPSAPEFEEYFTLHERDLRYCSEKYNFDFMNEEPLEGRYEWVRNQPSKSKGGYIYNIAGWCSYHGM